MRAGKSHSLGGAQHSARGTKLVLALATLLAATSVQAVTIDWTTIGNANNAPDDNGKGQVTYDYRIGTYEVTNAQYVEFLNLKDPTGTNTLSLYDGRMASETQGGITFTSGNPDGTKYSVQSGEDNHPVVFVNWYSSLRFTNWLNNGQGNGDTETGAYTLLGGTPIPSNGSTITRNSGASVFLPNQDEWYKAAYSLPATSTYFDYPTGSDTLPTAEATPPGAANSANYNNVISNVTNVGAYSSSPSPYGTFDQGGNVMEWVEHFTGSYAALGGNWLHDGSYLNAATNVFDLGNYDASHASVGFRVASIVPEPGTGLLAAMACIGLAMFRRRNKAVGA